MTKLLLCFHRIKVTFDNLIYGFTLAFSGFIPTKVHRTSKTMIKWEGGTNPILNTISICRILNGVGWGIVFFFSLILNGTMKKHKSIPLGYFALLKITTMLQLYSDRLTRADWLFSWYFNEMINFCLPNHYEIVFLKPRIRDKTGRTLNISTWFCSVLKDILLKMSNHVVIS